MIKIIISVISALSIEFIAVANNSRCINGAIRLNPLNESLLAPTQGLVEICIAGRWNRTCSSNISNDDARALCTIMGLPSNSKFILKQKYVPCISIKSLLTLISSNFGICFSAMILPFLQSHFIPIVLPLH